MRIFCDLDGVLTDFDGRFFELFGKYPNEFIDTYGYSSFWASLHDRQKTFGVVINGRMMEKIMAVYSSIQSNYLIFCAPPWQK